MIINRLEIKGELGFNQEFKKINIILGENKTGKTTFFKLILFVLGTNIDDFIDEIKKEELCRQAELYISCKNNNKYKIVRKLPYSESVVVYPVNEEGMVLEEEMEIYTLEEFSDFILEEEGYDSQVISYGRNKKASMRFYFLLRAIIVDQDTKASNILASLGGRSRNYINSQMLIKKAIVEELIGKENVQIQKLRFQLQEYLKERREINSKNKYISEMIEHEINENDSLSKNVKNITNRIQLIENERKELLKNNYQQLSKLENINNEISENKIKELKQDKNKKNDEIRQLKLEYEDLLNIIKNIENEIKELKEMAVARQVLTNIPVEKCPICFSNIQIDDKFDEYCPCCNKKIKKANENDNMDNILKFKKILDESLIEAKEAKNDIKRDLNKLEKERKNIIETLEKVKRSYFKKLEENKNPIEQIIDDLRIRLDKFSLEAEKLKRFRENLSYSQKLKEMKEEVAKEINLLRSELNELEKTSSKAEKKRIETWQNLFSSLLEEVYGDIESAELDTNYMPLIDGSKIDTISSASLKVVTRLIYILSLFQLKDKVSINHLGFVFFDSPKDKDLDVDKYKRFLEEVNKSKKGQIFITGSITEKYIYNDIFDDKDILIELNKYNKLLYRVNGA